MKKDTNEQKKKHADEKKKRKKGTDDKKKKDSDGQKKEAEKNLVYVEVDIVPAASKGENHGVTSVIVTSEEAKD